MNQKEKRTILIFDLFAGGYLLMNTYDLFRFVEQPTHIAVFNLIVDIALLSIFYKAKYYKEKLGLLAMVISGLIGIEALFTLLR